MEKEKQKLYPLERTRFIRWVSFDRPDKLYNLNVILNDLIKSGESIITAEDVLSTFSEIPIELLDNHDKKGMRGLVSVSASDCYFIYEG